MSVPLRRIAVAAAAVVAAGAGLIAGASTAGANPVRVVHAPVRSHHVAPLQRGHHVVHPTSTNWGGWDNVGGTYTTVSASWTQPTVTCAARETSYASFWIGLDGDGSSSVEQTGSEGDCVRGTPTYYSWYEFYPAYPVNYSDTVRPGDKFTSTVSYSASTGKYSLKLSDTTQGWTHTKSGSAPDGENASAEVIAEAPSSSTGVLPLAKFGSMSFTNATVNGKALGTVATAQKLTMASASYTKAAVSNLTNNTAFTVTWKHA